MTTSIQRGLRIFHKNLGFSKPNKVLCDGTFVHHLLHNEIIPADTVISKLMDDPVMVFTTRCVVAELKRLHNFASEFLDAANILITARCHHKGAISAEECLADVIGEDNSEQFFFATQSTELRKKLKDEKPGVPFITAEGKSIIFVFPSSKLMRDVTKAMRDGTYEEEDYAEGSTYQLLVRRAARNGRQLATLKVKDKVQFKKKKEKQGNNQGRHRSHGQESRRSSKDKLDLLIDSLNSHLNIQFQ